METKLYLNESDYQIVFKKLLEENDKYKQYFVELLINGKMIERPIEKNKNKKIMNESYLEYLELKVHNTDKEWIHNIIDHKSELNSIIFENNDIILIPDYKWDLNKKNLHILAIFKNKNLSSIRDLIGDDIKMLEESILIGKKIIKDKYDIKNLVIYFHYRPSVWQLHMHFMNVETDNKESFSLPRAHLVSSVINNLKNDSNYYINNDLEILVEN